MNKVLMNGERMDADRSEQQYRGGMIREFAAVCYELDPIDEYSEDRHRWSRWAWLRDRRDVLRRRINRPAVCASIEHDARSWRAHGRI